MNGILAGDPFVLCSFLCLLDCSLKAESDTVNISMSDLILLILLQLILLVLL